jgi:hypothetical protein
MTTNEMGLGEMMPEDPTDPPPLNLDISEADLDALIDNGTAPPSPADAPAPEAEAPDLEVVGEAAPEVKAEEQAEPEPVTEPEQAAPAPVVDPLVEQYRIEHEKLQAQLELQRAHASRLAGEIGHLRRQVTAPEPDGAEGYNQDPDLAQRFDRLESRINSDAIATAIAQEVQALQSPEVKALHDGGWLAKAAAPYEQDWTAATSATDANTARLLARAVARSTVADAKALQFQALREQAQTKAADQAAKLRERKIAAGATSTTPATAARPKPKTFSEMSEAEQDRFVDSQLGIS